MQPQQLPDFDDLKNLDFDKTHRVQKRIRIVTVIVLAIVAIFLVYGYSQEWFKSPQPLRDFFLSFGFFGFVLGFLLVVANTIFPVIPASLPSVAVFMAYGNVLGFILVSVYTLVGSIISFLLSRRFGETFVKAFVPTDVYDNLMGRITNEKTATKLAAIAFLVPGLPDDATVMVCGLTDMRLSRMIAICLIFKPLPTFLYLFGFSSLLDWLISLLQGM